MFKLTAYFKHEMIGIWQKISKKLRIKFNFELTVFELTMPNLYSFWVNSVWSPWQFIVFIKLKTNLQKFSLLIN